MLCRRYTYPLVLSLLCSGYAYTVHGGIEHDRNDAALSAQLSMDHGRKPVQLAQAAPSLSESTGNPALAPLKWVGVFYAESKAGGLRCTAQFIAPRVILTAAHCIQNNVTAEWYETEKMAFYLQYQNKTFSRQYNVICAARQNGWVPTIAKDATDVDKFVAFQRAFQYDFAMVLLDGESTTGMFRNVALDAAGDYQAAFEIGYPAAIHEGGFIQQDVGFLGLRYFPENVLALWHFNENMTEGISGGAWVANLEATEGPQKNVLVGLASNFNKLWSRTTFGPYLRKQAFQSMLTYVSQGCSETPPQGGKRPRH